MLKQFVILGFVVLGVTSGCIKEDSSEFSEVNTWIKNEMQTNYLWNERVPESVNGAIPPGAFFGSMLDPEDNISFILSNSNITPGETRGFTYTSGISPAFGQFSNTGGVFIIVEFVYPGSPADSAGFKRGDIILSIDGTGLTTGNFLQLFYAERNSVRYSLGNYDPEAQSIFFADSNVTVEQGELDLNPIVYSDIIEQNNEKVGYILYAGFNSGESEKYNDSLDVVLQEMKTEGISDLIVDLRYNEGGDFDAARNFANAIAPASSAQDEDVFIRLKYNDILEQQIIQEDGADSERLFIKFDEDPENIDLQRVYFLTTGKTSSTSELMINGLEPHMDVFTVGTRSAGEYFGSKIILGSDATSPNNYVIVPVILQYENSEGGTVSGGIEPDLAVTENLLQPFQIGDTQDPILSGALNSITSGSQSSPKIISKPYIDLIDERARKLGRIMFKSERN
jgi:C-terminal processing protease CtpA/Prc